ncbi:chloride channel protein [Nautilia sp.]
MGRLITASVIIGVLSGVFVTVYSLFTEFLTKFLYGGMENIRNLPWWYLYLIPTLSIFLVNYIISKNESVKEYGVLEIAKAVEENRLIFTLKDLFLKIFTSSISIASGFAVGNEGPSAAIGAMIAQKVHGFLKIPKNFLKLFLSMGASGGIAAVFVSPVTGIMFAIENIAYEFIKNYIGYIILSGVIAFSVSWHFLESLIFNYSMGKFIEYRYIFASLFFIPVITFFIYFYLWLKDGVLNFLNTRIPFKHKNRVFAIIGGGSIGTVLLISPYAAFSGHEIVTTLINNNFHLPLYFIFIIILLRITATAVSLYANAVGGIFIALMSIGALVGYGYGEALVGLGLKIEPFYFAAIGAAAFMGVNMKLPLTAIVMALEVTYDYNVIIPTAIITIISGYLAGLNFQIQKLKFKKGVK